MSLRGFFVDLALGDLRLLPGSGSPEGAVAARVGSLYLRDDGGAATTLYLKESGTGDTGWVAAGPRRLAITFEIDGGGSAITTGLKGFVRVPVAGTIVKATVLSTDAGATAGDIVIDIWKDTLANYPPTDADSITSSAPPTLSSANAAEDTTLTDWTTAIAAGDILAFNVDSAATVERVLVQLEVLPA